MRKELEQRLVERWPSWFKTEGLATDCKRDLLPSYRTFQRRLDLWDKAFKLAVFNGKITSSSAKNAKCRARMWKRPATAR